MSAAEPYMTPKEVAAYLRKSRSWVYAATERGELPAKRIGRDLRYNRAELEQWLERQSAATPPASLKGGG